MGFWLDPVTVEVYIEHSYNLETTKVVCSVCYGESGFVF